MRLEFSAPVAKEWVNQIVLKGPGEKIWKPELKEEEEFFQWVSFKAPFPEDSSFVVEIPSGLKDDAGRALVNADKFPLSVRTADYPPLAKFSSRFGILESKADPVLPVTLRNLEPQVKGKMLKVGKEEGIFGRVIGKIFDLPPERVGEVQSWLRKVETAKRENSILGGETAATAFQLPKPEGARAFEVVGIPLKKNGLYIVELESAILGASLINPPKPMFVPTAVLVTNLSVHFKWGRESSLVWVTTLDKAEPVKDALVTVRDCRETILQEGKTDGDGLLRIHAALPAWRELPRCENREGGLFVTAQTRDDMAFVRSSWDDGIEPWRFQLPYEDYRGPMMAHTIFDRTLLRAGQTVHMKHILRERTTEGFAMVPGGKRPDLVSIRHRGSDQKYEFPLNWDGSGIAETTWPIPKEARLGHYGVVMVKKSETDPKKIVWQRSSGEFRVEEFRVPLLRGTIQPPSEPLIEAKEVPLDLSVQYLAGGGAGDLPVKLRGEIRPRFLPSFEGFDRFRFSNGSVKEGLVRRGDSLEEGEMEGETMVEGSKRVILPSQDLVLDRSGSARATLAKLPPVDAPKEILAEMEFKDPNGEIQTVATRVPLWPAKYLIGIKPDSWAVSKENLKFHVAVLDLAGKPVAGAEVKAELFQQKTYSHRKRIAGGFYAYDHTEETRKIGPICSGKTDARGLLICEGRAPVSGDVIVQAECFDEAGRRVSAWNEIWVAEKEEWWFAVGDHDRIDLLPERKRYEPGETAVFQVRMPFREATTLVTVEREGIIEARVEKISGKKPVIEVPVKGSYAPNVFVSVLPVRGRVADIQPTAKVDLGRPAFKLGIAEINVGWREHELKVDVSPDRRVYKVRQKARVKMKVRTWDGKTPPPGSEVAVAAVDEGLLELMSNRSWKILAAMMGRRGYGIQTATAQSQVIGKRHFGLKALPQGGGGGRGITRELFDTLLIWKARLPLDANGEAALEIPLNDSITGFNIAAVATGGTGLFGTGSATIQSTQDLMIFSGLPPLVREGDRFRSEFTLRNTTRRGMEIEVTARAEGIPGSFSPLSVLLKPGQAREIGWEVSVPAGLEKIPWEVAAREKGVAEGDRILISQKVTPAVPVRTFQATIHQIEGEVKTPVEKPADGIAGRGGIKVSLRAKLADGLNGVKDYMGIYPYGCLEQKISRAVALRDEKIWNALMVQLPSYQDGDGLVKYFPAMRLGDEVLTSYILAIGHEAGWSIPPAILERMATGLKNFIQGFITRGSALPTVDLALRKLTAMEALSRVRRFEAKLLNSIAIEPNLWPTSAVIDWLNLLRNERTLSRRTERLGEAENILWSRINFQGTVLNFSTERADCLWWMMVSGDVNAVRTVLALLPLEKWKEDMPRLVQGVLARQRKGRWDLTLANAWGVLAMEKFSRTFEATPVSGSTQAGLPGESQALQWKESPKGEVYSFPWPERKEVLSIVHKGEGRPWATIQSLAAIPLKESLSSGYKIQKTITPIDQKDRTRFSRGDLLRIRLEMEAQADQTWVVVSDPVPAGSTILGTGLARDSQILTRDEKTAGWAWPVYEERSFEGFRAYYRYVPKGKWTAEYTIRVNQSGIFHLPPTRVEALYFPEMFGEIPNRSVEVRP